MGIKNLAFCVADVQTRAPGGSKKGSTAKSKTEQELALEMRILAWRRLDVVDEVSKATSDAVSPQSPDIQPPSNSIAKSVDEGEDSEGPYTPGALSTTAYTLVKNTLLPHKPDIILIERQRWRSMGSPSIQQWTVRVNTLEGMFWAILTALRGRATHVYDVFGVDPKRVGHFWLGQEIETETESSTAKKKPKASKTKSKKAIKQADGEEIDVGPEGEVEEVLENNKTATATKKLSRSKAEKKAKIQLLRSWLTKSKPSVESKDSPVLEFAFNEESGTVKDALCETEKKGKGKSKIKMDDVTDCFLQAAAWVAWEGNRVRVLRGIEEMGMLEGVGKSTEEKDTTQEKSGSTTKLRKGREKRSKEI